MFLKNTHLIMVDIKITFRGTESSKTNKCQLEVFATTNNELVIAMKDVKFPLDENFKTICLNRQTAIRLHKELKKQIALLNMEELSNG